MGREAVQTAVRTTLAVLVRVAGRTRSQADDLMTQILCANEGRIVAAVERLLADPQQPPTDEQITAALRDVGINV
jgi:hypothetical protein